MLFEVGGYGASEAKRNRRVYATQHLAESMVQIAQPAMEGRFAFAVVLHRRRSVRMPRGVRERALLSKEQQGDTCQSQHDTLQGWDSGYVRLGRSSNVNQLEAHPQLPVYWLG
jgi:hypothetical protein